MSGARELACRLGLHRAGNSWRGDCPACGYSAALSLTERGGRPLWWCASCGDQRAVGAALRAAGGLHDGPAPGVRPVSPKPASDDVARRARAIDAARALWDRALPAAGTLADQYLAGRGLPRLAGSPALRFLPAHRHPNDGGSWPILIAAVRDVTGEIVAIHRTYLARDGRGKAAIDPAKMTLGPVSGGAIRLDPIAPELAIGEGIESSASAGQLLGRPAWAAVSAGNLASGLILPAEVRTVVIAADNDPPGRRAAQAAAARWQAEGRRVRIALPDREAADFNDVLRDRLARDGAHG